MPLSILLEAIEPEFGALHRFKTLVRSKSKENVYDLLHERFISSKGMILTTDKRIRYKWIDLLNFYG